MTDANAHGASSPPSPAIIDAEVFGNLLAVRAGHLLRIARSCLPLRPEQFRLTRPLLNQLIAEASQLEELLDSYGARTNNRWYVFRVRIAALKNFSQAGYELLHLSHAMRSYNLVERTPAFAQDTQEAIDYLSGLLLCCLRHWHDEAQALGLPPPPPPELSPESFSEDLPGGMLPRDRTRTHQETAKSRVLSLATQFLHGTESASFLRVVSRTPPEKYLSLIGDPVSEESLRGLEVRFHNLQSLYDTYVSDSGTETLDAQLPALRGHISAVLHLLRISTIFVHFYERHICLNRQALFCRDDCALGLRGFLHVTMGYCLGYSYAFLQMARSICRETLWRYAEVDTVDVPVPRFHGFHVRPSALVAAIVGHYGSDVAMECGGVRYNAGVPMDLFRANEWINRQKRERVYEHLSSLPLDAIDRESTDRRHALREVLIRLAERGAIVIHRHPLPVEKFCERPDVPFDELVRLAIAALLAERRINIQSDIAVRFQGDKRVLADIRVLAENGYGENDSGNNIDLPDELGYLSFIRGS